MDPGSVVWLPGTGYDEDQACAEAYGYNYHACGDEPYLGGTLVFCCPY